MIRKRFIFLWILVLTTFAVSILCLSVKRTPFDLSLWRWYMGIFFPERHLEFVLPMSLLAFSMLPLSLVAWCKRPGIYSLFGTIVAGCGLCGIPGMYVIASSVMTFPGDSFAQWGAEPRPWMFFALPSLYIIYHFVRSFADQNNTGLDIIIRH